MSILLGSPSLDFMYMSASAPEAPPLSETTTGCFIRLFFWMADCIMRAIWSDAPPAPAATTISTGLFGSQAKAGGLDLGHRVLLGCHGRQGQKPPRRFLSVGRHSAALRLRRKCAGAHCG